MNIPEGIKFSVDHEWIKVEGDTATIGISDYAQSELGDIVYIDIDSDLSEISISETFGSIEAVKTVSDLLMPVSGEVLEVNPKLEDTPEIINTDPFGDGWLIKIKVQDTSDLNDLLDHAEYKELINT